MQQLGETERGLKPGTTYLILGKTGAHRAPLQLAIPQFCNILNLGGELHYRELRVKQWPAFVMYNLGRYVVYR